MTDRGVARGIVDASGCLTQADPRLLALNARAGGEIGRPVAVVQLATIARLAQRLGILIARGVTVADGDADLDLWVRAQPRQGHVELAICGWRERAAWRAAPIVPVSQSVGGGWRWAVDAALRLTDIAADVAPGLGIDRPALLGQPLTRLFRLDERDGGALPILEALARRRDFAGQPAAIRGSGVAVTLAAVARRDRAGGFAGYVGRAESVPDAAIDDQVLTDAFTAGLERALRAPLGRIVADADSINAQAEGPLQQDYVDYAADIASAGRHLIDLIDDLADLAAIERPDFAIPPEPVDMADVARRAAGLLSVRAADNGVRIDRPEASDRLPANGEFRRALQILVNLVGNAVRYSPPGGVVWVKTEQDDDRALVIVADQGPGIAPEDQERIFDKFARVDPTEPGGNGLGLYIARRLARAMGGDLTVDSAPGEGARFMLTLPTGSQATPGEDQRQS